MGLLLSIRSWITDTLIAPFAGVGGVVGLGVLGLLSAPFFLILFKKISRQEKIRFHKNKIMGYILEIAIFRDQFGKICMNQVHILRHYLVYLGYVAIPLIGLMAPMALVCMEIDTRLGYGPLETGETFQIHARLEKEKVPLLSQVVIETSGNIGIETQPLRIPSDNSIIWRGRVLKRAPQGFIRIRLSDGSESFVKEVVTEAPPDGFSPESVKTASIRYWANTGSPPIPSGMFLQSVRVGYPERRFPFLTWHLSAVTCYVIWTLLFGLIVKPLVRVSI